MGRSEKLLIRNGVKVKTWCEEKLGNRNESGKKRKMANENKDPDKLGRNE